MLGHSSDYGRLLTSNCLLDGWMRIPVMLTPPCMRTLGRPRRYLTNAFVMVPMPSRKVYTEVSRILSSTSPNSYETVSPVDVECRDGRKNPDTTEPFPRSSASQIEGNVERRLSFRASAAYIPCTSALAKILENSPPKRLVMKLSTDSSSIPSCLFQRLKGSLQTEERRRRLRFPFADKPDHVRRSNGAEGRRWRPPNSGTYRKRLQAACDVFGIVTREDDRSKR